MTYHNCVILVNLRYRKNLFSNSVGFLTAPIFASPNDWCISQSDTFRKKMYVEDSILEDDWKNKDIRHTRKSACVF